MDNERLRHIVRAEDENIKTLFIKLPKTVFDILNNDLASEAMHERVLEWQEIKKRLGAQGIVASIGLRDVVVVTALTSETENSLLYGIPDENPQ